MYLQILFCGIWGWGCQILKEPQISLSSGFCDKIPQFPWVLLCLHQWKGTKEKKEERVLLSSTLGGRFVKEAALKGS
jgi:hypothetical protein